MKNANAVGSHVPGRIEAESYGHEGLGKSFFVKDTTKNVSSVRHGSLTGHRRPSSRKL